MTTTEGPYYGNADLLRSTTRNWGSLRRKNKESAILRCVLVAFVLVMAIALSL